MQDFLNNPLSIDDTVILSQKGCLEIGRIMGFKGKDRVFVKIFSWDPPKDVVIHQYDLYKISQSELTKYLLKNSK